MQSLRQLDKTWSGFCSEPLKGTSPSHPWLQPREACFIQPEVVLQTAILCRSKVQRPPAEMPNPQVPSMQPWEL